jgi:hypothetical protein
VDRDELQPRRVRGPERLARVPLQHGRAVSKRALRGTTSACADVAASRRCRLRRGTTGPSPAAPTGRTTMPSAARTRRPISYWSANLPVTVPRHVGRFWRTVLLPAAGPEPVHARIEIRFSLAAAGALADRYDAPAGGPHRWQGRQAGPFDGWDGRDDRGRAVPAGVSYALSSARQLRHGSLRSPTPLRRGPAGRPGSGRLGKG